MGWRGQVSSVTRETFLLFLNTQTGSVSLFVCLRQDRALVPPSVSMCVAGDGRRSGGGRCVCGH